MYEEEGEQLAGSYAIFFAEGDSLAKQGEYAKAIESFSKALEFQPEDRACLVSRSKCYLQLGDTAAALKDAETSLKEDSKYHGGLYRKAETLYRMGDFEHALMFYHRGSKIRPDLNEFKLGIQKAQEAISNSIGTPEACKLDKTGDLSFFKQQDTVGKKKQAKTQKAAHHQIKAKQGPVASEKTMKELLGELYADREYLERLSKDSKIGKNDSSIYTLINEGVTYLDSRAEFWRQQKPMYTRKREKILRRWKPPPTRPLNPSSRHAKSGKDQFSDHTKFVLKALEDIDNSLANGDAEKSLSEAEQTMMTVMSLTDADLPNRSQFIATLHSSLGNAYLELGQTDHALEHFQKDMKIAEEEGYDDALGRSLYNLGRVYSIMGKYEEGIQFWLKRVPLLKTSEESAWLFHEIGRCYWEAGNYTEAKEHGEKSLKAAEESHDQFWQLNASMLIAQTEVKLGNLPDGLSQFKSCLALAEVLDDTDSQEAIKKAIEEVNTQIVDNIQQPTATQD